MNFKTALEKKTHSNLFYTNKTTKVRSQTSYPVTGRELNAARVLLDNLFNFLPCSCQSDLKHNQ